MWNKNRYFHPTLCSFPFKLYNTIPCTQGHRYEACEKILGKSALFCSIFLESHRVFLFGLWEKSEYFTRAQKFMKLMIYMFCSITYLRTYVVPILTFTTLLANLADGKFGDIFLIFPRKQDLTFLAKCLQFA